MKCIWYVLLGWRVLLAIPNLFAEGLPKSSPQAENISHDRLEILHRKIQQYIDDGKHAGAISMILRNGRVADLKAYGQRDIEQKLSMEVDTICRIYSMTKVVTSVAALQLYEQGKFRLDDPVEKYIPSFNGLKVLTGGTVDSPVLENCKQPMTIRMLFNHTSGLSYDLFEGSPVHQMYRQQDLWNSSSLREFIRKISKLPLIAQPGTLYQYSVSDDVLGYLIEHWSGESFEAYVRKNITEPLGMVDTFFDVPEGKRHRVAAIHEIGKDGKLKTTPPIIGTYAEPGSGIPAGGAGLFSTIGDYARFAQMILNGGHLDGIRVLSRKTVELMTANHLTHLPRTTHQFSETEGWGLAGAVRTKLEGAEPGSVGQFSWSGAATTHFNVDPKERSVILIFCQHIPFDQHGIFVDFRTLFYSALTD